MNDSVDLKINNRTVQVWRNPAGDLGLLQSLIRFTADNQTKTIYTWGFHEAYHSDVSIGLNLTDAFNSTNFLKGHAKRNDSGFYVMIGSDYLNSFLGRLVRGDRAYLMQLLNNDWSWVETCVHIKGWIAGYRSKLSL